MSWYSGKHGQGIRYSIVEYEAPGRRGQQLQAHYLRKYEAERDTVLRKGVPPALHYQDNVHSQYF